MSLFDAAREPGETDRHHRHQHQHTHRQRNTDVKHDPEGQDQDKHHAAVLHQTLSDSHPQRLDIRRETVHQIARVLGPKIPPVQARQVIEQMPANGRLDRMAHAQRHLPHPVGEHAGHSRRARIEQQPQQQRATPQPAGRQPVNCHSRNEGDADIEAHREQRDRHAPQYLAPMRRQIAAKESRMGAWLGHISNNCVTDRQAFLGAGPANKTKQTTPPRNFFPSAFLVRRGRRGGCRWSLGIGCWSGKSEVGGLIKTAARSQGTETAISRQGR